MEWYIASPEKLNSQPVLLYPTKLPFIIEEVKTFHDTQKLKQFTITNPALTKILKGILHTEEEYNCNHENMGKNKSYQMSRWAKEN
jgi:hypothetical protein